MAMPDRRYSLVGYFLGASLAVHAVNWLGGSYFGQVNFLYLITIGGLHSLASRVPELEAAQRPVVPRPAYVPV